MWRAGIHQRRRKGDDEGRIVVVGEDYHFDGDVLHRTIVVVDVRGSLRDLRRRQDDVKGLLRGRNRSQSLHSRMIRVWMLRRNSAGVRP